MTGAGGPRLVVEADLTVRVTDPRGRTAAVVVDDHDGAVRVRVDTPAGLGVLAASLPRRLPPGVRVPRLRHRPDGPRWEQDVEVLVGSRLVLSRRGGRWRPTPVAVAPVLVAAGSALAAVGVLLALVVRSVRSVRSARAVARRRPRGDATG